METAISLYGALVLTILGFVLPILTIFLSLFPEGVKILTTKYENEKKQSEDNILGEAEKKKLGGDLDYNILAKNLKLLKKKRKQAEARLVYLKPTSLAIRVSIPFAVAFLGALFILFTNSHVTLIISLVSSVLGFSCGVSILWTCLIILVEVSEIVNQSKRESENKVIELLSKLLEKSGDNLFLREDKIRIELNNKALKKDDVVPYSINTAHSIPLSVRNSSEMLAKKVEVGLIFPLDVVIEETSNIASIYAHESSQIVRFKRDEIQAREENKLGNLKITFLKAGEASVDAFIKGENVKPQRFSFKLNIIE